MKKILIAAVALLVTPQAAIATTGLICSTGGEGPVHLALAVSHTAVPAVASVRLTSNGREVPVVVAQSWFDPSEVRIDLTDRNAARHEARLRATWRAASRSYDGSLWRAGKRWWIRCREG